MSSFIIVHLLFFFFFSSRRRHTRLQGDWSSHVCSSDLPAVIGNHQVGVRVPVQEAGQMRQSPLHLARSEERREGKSVDLGGRRIIKKKKKRIQEYNYNKKQKKKKKQVI